MLNPADSDFVSLLDAHLPEGCIRPIVEAYLREPRGRYHGLAGAVAAPRSTEKLAQVVSLCFEARVGIVPRSGGTGLFGGKVMTEGPAQLLLSLGRMSRIRACYPEDNVLIAEAYEILKDVHVAAEAVNRLYPLTLGSQGSCRIGVNLATNAGGVNVLRYGNAREICLGVETVLADGTIFHGRGVLRFSECCRRFAHMLLKGAGKIGGRGKAERN